MQLTDRFTLETGAVYLTGIQALVRLPLDQMRRDRRAGLKTGTFISGYEGSPLGGYDLALQRAGKLLAEHDVHFWPGMNEDMAATAVFGSQIHDIAAQSEYEGIRPGVAGSDKQSAALVLGLPGIATPAPGEASSR